MPNKSTHGHSKPRRAPEVEELADELEPEITAQPRPLSDDIVAAAADERGLSLDPEELGSHFLSEAVEQGEDTARDVAELELALREDPEAVERPSAEIAMWAKLTELAARDSGASGQLFEAADLGADRLEAERTELPEPAPNDSVSVSDAGIREVSLLDQEGAGQGEVVAPRIDLEEAGRHARSTPREALGAQVRGAAPRAAKHARKLKHAARTKLQRAAGKLRRVAKQLAHASHR